MRCPVSLTRTPKPGTSVSMVSYRLPVCLSDFRVRSVSLLRAICPPSGNGWATKWVSFDVAQ